MAALKTFGKAWKNPHKKTQDAISLFHRENTTVDGIDGNRSMGFSGQEKPQNSSPSNTHTHTHTRTPRNPFSLLYSEGTQCVNGTSRSGYFLRPGDGEIRPGPTQGGRGVGVTPPGREPGDTRRSAPFPLPGMSRRGGGPARPGRGPGGRRAPTRCSPSPRSAGPSAGEKGNGARSPRSVGFRSEGTIVMHVKQIASQNPLNFFVGNIPCRYYLFVHAIFVPSFNFHSGCDRRKKKKVPEGRGVRRTNLPLTSKHLLLMN